MGYVMTDGFTFKVDYDKREAALVEYDGTAANVKIPAEINDCVVFSIFRDVFKDNKTIKTVTIPYTVNFVGARAFMKSSVESVKFEDKDYISNNRCTLYHSVFMDCEKLHDVRLRQKTMLSDWSVFANCKNLSTINFENIIERIPKYAFLNCEKLKFLKVATPVIFEEKAFFGTQLNILVEDMADSDYSDDFIDMIKNAEIHCQPNSKLAELAYSGSKVILLGL